MILGLFGFNTDLCTSSGFEYMKEGFDGIMTQMDVLLAQMGEGFSKLGVLTVRVEINNYHISLGNIYDAYQDYVKSTNIYARDNQYEVFSQQVCNFDLDKTLSNIFWHLYSHTCKDCNFGDGRLDTFFLNTYKATAKYDINDFKNGFQQMITYALAEAMYLHGVCLPCTDVVID